MVKFGRYRGFYTVAEVKLCYTTDTKNNKKVPLKLNIQRGRIQETRQNFRSYFSSMKFYLNIIVPTDDPTENGNKFGEINRKS